MYVRVCVLGLEHLRFRSFSLFVPPQRGGAAVSGLHHGRQGVAPAPRFQLYVRCAGPCRARGGCRAPVSVSGASVAQGAMLCESECGVLDACTAGWLGDCRLWLV